MATWLLLGRRCAARSMEDERVAQEETALLVLRYLERDYPTTAAAYRREAAGLLRDVPQPEGEVKRLDEILDEYVALEAAARKRTNYERTFGDNIAARSLLSKIGRLLDDYLAARHGGGNAAAGFTAAEASAGATLPKGRAAPPAPMAMAAVIPPAMSELGPLPASRQRKSRKPNRRPAGAEGVMVNSRRLFGRGAEAMAGGLEG